MKELLAALLLGLAFHSSTWARELLVTEQEEYCLALNDYYEARGESLSGRIAVAFVVLNRVRASGYNRTVCETVFQTSRGVCAFSWVCSRYQIRERDSWAESLRFANTFLRGYKNIQDPTLGAVHYHEQTISPYWAKEYSQNLVIGSHVFYPRERK